ncbi:MAG: cardiolipin synthetase 2, partial [Burkholderia sp.]|nr:cardiolipin synthetase 2 [Burkholderia sp.]
MHGLVVALGLLIYVLSSHAMQKRRDPTAAISWVLAIALIPYVGLPLYLLFGSRKRLHARRLSINPVSNPGLLPEDAWPRQLAAAMGQPPAEGYRGLRVHADGHEALNALFGVIDSAQHELAVCTFILGRDAVGRALLARLVARARSGVRVRLMVDGFGRLLGGHISLRELKAAGAGVVLFGPVLRLPGRSRANLRNHRKIVVADGERLWCGGRNFASEYFEGAEGRAPWRDITFDIHGPFAMQALDLFNSDWTYATGSARPPRRVVEERPAEPYAQLIASGPDQADDTVHNLLVTACFRAHTHIVAVTPYFVPGEALLMALTLAARREVTVDLVLPAHSNHHLADFVRHRALRTLAAAGGRIWLTPYMLHAKAVVIDFDLALAGSSNLDARSMFLNYEFMVAFYATPDIRQFADVLEQHRAAAQPYRAGKPSLWRDFTE